MAPTPNFFLIGAAKSGTTSLYHYLRSHPDIFLPGYQEPRYYAYEGEQSQDFDGPDSTKLIRGIVRTETEYRDLFSGVDGESGIGDVSPAYLYSPVAASRILEAHPNARIIAILRNPVERAYSHFVDNLGKGWEPCDNFVTVLDEELRGKRSDWWRKWDYIGHGYYHPQLQRYFHVFPSDQIRVYLFEDLKEDTTALVRDILTFLNVDPNFNPETNRRHNPSGLPRYELLRDLLGTRNPVRTTLKWLLPTDVRERIRRTFTDMNRHKPELPDEARQTLREIYRDDIYKLENLIGQDLSAWKS